MSLVMRDSITPANLTPGANAYAGYVDGRWPNFPEVKTAFPGAQHLSIAVFASSDAHCLDVETYDATPAQAPAWVKRQQGRGVTRPCIYASVSVMADVLHELAAAGIARSEVRLWSAHYGAGHHICGPDTCKWPGVPAMDGTQWTNAAPGTGGTVIDESALLDTFFPAPAPPSPPPPPVQDGYLVSRSAAGGWTGRAVVSADGGHTWS